MTCSKMVICQQIVSLHTVTATEQRATVVARREKEHFWLLLLRWVKVTRGVLPGQRIQITRHTPYFMKHRAKSNQTLFTLFKK